MSEEKSPRPFSEILIDMDNADCMGGVIDLYNELISHKKTYTIVELRFAKEHADSKRTANILR